MMTINLSARRLDTGRAHDDGVRRPFPIRMIQDSYDRDRDINAPPKNCCSAGRPNLREEGTARSMIE